MSSSRDVIQTSEPDPIPELERLHERHIGLSESVCLSYAEAARVCLDRHHQPPVEFQISNGESESREFTWQPSNSRARMAWGNRDDATRDGAYSIALAATEVEREWFAIGRAETRTGADYYVAPSDSDGSLEDAYRLEVSGIDKGNASAIGRRLKEKVEQARRGSSELSAVACVVGFEALLIAFRNVEE